MRKIIPLLLFAFPCSWPFTATGAPSAIEPNRIELRSQIDSVSYFLGAIYGKELFPEREFLMQTVDIEIFLSGVKDGLYDMLMDVDMGNLDFEDFMERKYNQYKDNKIKEATFELRQKMEEEGFSTLENGSYYKIIKEGEGKKATEWNQILDFHVITYDHDGNQTNDTRLEEDDPLQNAAVNFFEFIGDEIREFLKEGTVFQLRTRKVHTGYEDVYFEFPKYETLEFEILEVSEPIPDLMVR